MFLSILLQSARSSHTLFNPRLSFPKCSTLNVIFITFVQNYERLRRSDSYETVWPSCRPMISAASHQAFEYWCEILISLFYDLSFSFCVFLQLIPILISLEAANLTGKIKPVLSSLFILSHSNCTTRDAVQHLYKVVNHYLLMYYLLYSSSYCMLMMYQYWFHFFFRHVLFWHIWVSAASARILNLGPRVFWTMQKWWLTTQQTLWRWDASTSRLLVRSVLPHMRPKDIGFVLKSTSDYSLFGTKLFMWLSQIMQTGVW